MLFFLALKDVKNPPEGVPDGLDESDLSGTPSQHFWPFWRVAKKTRGVFGMIIGDLSFFPDIQCWCIYLHLEIWLIELHLLSIVDIYRNIYQTWSVWVCDEPTGS